MQRRLFQASVKAWLLILLISSTSCAVFTRRSAEPSGDIKVAPTEPREELEVRPPQRQAPLPKRPPRVGLVLGPGGYKAFAHAGVLKELTRARIPIEAVVGLEWGSLVGALYAQKGQIHEAEWKLYKLQSKDLPGRSFFGGELKPESIQVLKSFLNENVTRAGRPTVDFACPALSLANGQLRWMEGPDLLAALEVCLPFPPLFLPERDYVSGAFAVSEALGRLRQQGIELLVVVDVLGRGNLLDRRQLPSSSSSVILWQEVRRSLRASQSLAGEVIEVETSAYGMLDFDRRKELFRAGEVAGAKAAEHLSRKYGF